MKRLYRHKRKKEYLIYCPYQKSSLIIREIGFLIKMNDDIFLSNYKITYEEISFIQTDRVFIYNDEIYIKNVVYTDPITLKNYRYSLSITSDKILIDMLDKKRNKKDKRKIIIKNLVN